MLRRAARLGDDGGVLLACCRRTAVVCAADRLAHAIRGSGPDDARQTGQILAQAQIPFEPTADGAGIRVPAAQLDKARLVTAAKGGVKSGRLGFEIFDKPNWVGSEFDEQVNYQRALEGELEHTVGTLSDVAVGAGPPGAASRFAVSRIRSGRPRLRW